MYVCIYVLSVCYCTHLSGKLLDVNFEVGHKSRCPLLVRDLGTKKATSSQQPTYSQLVCTHTTRLIVDWLAALYKPAHFTENSYGWARKIFSKKSPKNSPSNVCRTTRVDIRYLFGLEANLGAHEFIRPDGLHERDCMRIELVGLVGLVYNGEWNSEIEPLEVSNLKHHTRERK